MNSLKGPGKQINHYTSVCRAGQKPSSGQSSTVYSLINEQQSRHQEGCLTNYEPLKKKYRMDSAEFFYRFENALIKESPEYVSWWVSYSAFAGTLQRYNLTRSDVECLLMEDFVTTTGDSKPS